MTEVFRGANVNDDQHAADNTLKIVHSLIYILKADHKPIPNLILQTTVILSEMYVGNKLKFVHKEYRKVTIPRNHGQRYKWLAMERMLAYLNVSLEYTARRRRWQTTSLQH